MIIHINLWYVLTYVVGYFVCLILATAFAKEYQKECGHNADEGMRWVFSTIWPVMIPFLGLFLFCRKIVEPFCNWFSLNDKINDEEEIQKAKDLIKEIESSRLTEKVAS